MAQLELQEKRQKDRRGEAERAQPAEEKGKFFLKHPLCVSSTGIAAFSHTK